MNGSHYPHERDRTTVIDIDISEDEIPSKKEIEKVEKYFQRERTPKKIDAIRSNKDKKLTKERNNAKSK